MPIAQLGCAAGGAAVNRAHDFCTAYPDANVLIVACEFCSLCYQPTDLGVGSLLSNGLFGDGIAAAVVRGSGGTGIRLERNGSYVIPDTEDWISYAVRSTGFHFQLDKRVPGTMEPLAPALQRRRRTAPVERQQAGLLHHPRRRSAHPGRPEPLPRRAARGVPLQPGDAHRVRQHRQRGGTRRPGPHVRRGIDPPRPARHDGRLRTRHHRRDLPGHAGPRSPRRRAEPHHRMVCASGNPTGKPRGHTTPTPGPQAPRAA